MEVRPGLGLDRATDGVRKDIRNIHNIHRVAYLHFSLSLMFLGHLSVREEMVLIDKIQIVES
jgi:hypothetical protein